MSIRIVMEKCTGCSLCLKSCPFAAIEIVNKKAVIDLTTCTLCGACVQSCRLKAIEIDKTEKACVLPDIGDFRGVWVFIEQKKGKVQSISYELLGKAHELAKKRSTEVGAVFIGNDLADQVDEVIWHPSLSANFHGGTLVVNYPYDNNAAGADDYTPCPDDP